MLLGNEISSYPKILACYFLENATKSINKIIGEKNIYRRESFGALVRRRNF